MGIIKAASLLDMEIIYVPLLENSGYVPDLSKFRSSINKNTVMLVASAPQYPQGLNLGLEKTQIFFKTQVPVPTWVLI